jgi:kynureninase
MADGFVPASGMRRFTGGTPPVLGMVPMQDMLELIEGGRDRDHSRSRFASPTSSSR